MTAVSSASAAGPARRLVRLAPRLVQAHEAPDGIDGGGAGWPHLGHEHRVRLEKHRLRVLETPLRGETSTPRAECAGAAP